MWYIDHIVINKFLHRLGVRPEIWQMRAFNLIKVRRLYMRGKKWKVKMKVNFHSTFITAIDRRDINIDRLKINM